MDVSKLNSSALFTQYVDIVNRSLGENRDEFPFDKLLDATDDFLGDRQISVAIYKDDPKNPHDWFTIGFDDGTFGIAQRGKSDGSDIDWRVSEDYLRKVVTNPDRYIENPARLDFDWLKARVGIA